MTLMKLVNIKYSNYLILLGVPFSFMRKNAFSLDPQGLVSLYSPIMQQPRSSSHLPALHSEIDIIHLHVYLYQVYLPYIITQFTTFCESLLYPNEHYPFLRFRIILTFPNVALCHADLYTFWATGMDCFEFCFFGKLATSYLYNTKNILWYTFSILFRTITTNSKLSLLNVTRTLVIKSGDTL